MRERIEQVGDILLAAAHADHHVEAAEIDRIEQILKEIWRQQPTPDAEVRRVAQFKEGETIDAEEMARLGNMLRDLQPKEELPATLVQRLADFDPARFDIDEAVGPFLHESVEFKRNLLQLAVSVHEADGELDFAEDTFIRELGFKLGLEMKQFQDLLLEFVPDLGASGSRDLASNLQTQLLVPQAGEPTNLSAPSNGRLPPGKRPVKKAAPVAKKAPAAAKKKVATKKAPAAKKKAAPVAKKKGKKPPAASKKKVAKKKAPAAKKKAAKKKKR
jgi:uncharacterized tellurite resistance protein B-like protein